MNRKVDITSIVSEKNLPDYDILVVNNTSLVNAIQTLIKEVNKRCQEGWKREGDIIISPIKTSSEYSVLYAVKKRHDETSKVSEYDIIVECAASVSQAIKVLVKDIEARCQMGWKREGKIEISPIMEMTNKVVVYHVVTR